MKSHLSPAYKLILISALLILALKILLGIVAEYHRYLPPDFASAFLIGREPYFFGSYQIAFYLHIAAGPPSILLCVALVLSGAYQGFVPSMARFHRRVGNLLWPIVIFILAPSGAFMAPYAMAGLPSTIAFLCLSFATALAAVLTVFHSRTHRIDEHRIWAGRCAVLLLSPLLLRLVGGLLSLIQFEAPVYYQLNAWLSWLVPLTVYECLVTRGKHQPAEKNNHLR
ncbi:MAG: DUF2306 domain-containing protein [Aureliella sp.]